MESDRSSTIDRLIGQFRRTNRNESQTAIPTVEAERYNLTAERSGVVVSPGSSSSLRQIQGIRSHNHFREI